MAKEQKKPVKRIRVTIDVIIFDTVYSIKDLYDILKVFEEVHQPSHIQLKIIKEQNLPCDQYPDN